MPRKKPRISADIFNAVSAPTRIQTLRLLATRGPLAYSEIMEMLDFEPTKDAGKFVYHLRNLVDTGLVDLEKATRKYKITELGLMVVSFSQDLDEYALKKSGRLLVRTSRYTIEEFDRNKITLSLIEEAGVPPDLAGRISSEAEERLLKLPTRYLTAPLIREFVNAILIEKGLEDYRHKLTRLGMPVHDVTNAIERASKKLLDVESVHNAAGCQVMAEYMLLEALPREVADAHLSGQIHVCNSGFWMLKPSSIYHDLRQFLLHGLKTQAVNLSLTSVNPPRNFFEAIMLTSNVVDLFRGEVSGEQTLDYFNIFLAPYLSKEPAEDAKNMLKSFLARLSLMGRGASHGVTLGLEVTVPQNLKKAEVACPEGVKAESYQEFEEETRRILWLLLEAAAEQSVEKPLFNPHLVLKFRPECLTEKYDVVEKAHELAANYGTLYVANLTREPAEVSSYMATGERVGADWTKDWEVDTLRSGCLDNVALNLPRVAYEARKSDNRFFDNLAKLVEISSKALELKSRAMGERVKQGLLPYLSQQIKQDSYYRPGNSTGVISIVGLNEAVKSHVDYQIHEDLMPQHFAVQVVEYLVNLVNSMSEKSGARFSASQVTDDEASQRMAEHDVERYGWSVVYTQGGKEHPYYTYTTAVADEPELTLKERLQLEEKFHPMFRGGHFTPVHVGEDMSGEALLKQTKEICESYNIGLLAYTYTLSYCRNCKRTFKGYKQRCPVCDTTQIVHYARQSTQYLPLTWWTHHGRLSLIKR